jgi:hypothetical protein
MPSTTNGTLGNEPIVRRGCCSAPQRELRAQISSLLERMNGYSPEQQMLALQNLEREAQEENAIMHELARKGRRDSASVRILTIITLIYLPCTVVSVSRPPPLYVAYTHAYSELLLNTVRASRHVRSRRHDDEVCGKLVDVLRCVDTAYAVHHRCVVYMGKPYATVSRVVGEAGGAQREDTRACEEIQGI